MAGIKLDGAGIAKMKTLEEADLLLQRIHGMVEQYAIGVKQNKPVPVFVQQIKRTLPILVGLLKGQFGLISDQAAALNLQAGRGGSEQMKVRVLREGVGQLRQALEIAAARVKDQHKVEEPAKGAN